MQIKLNHLQAISLMEILGESTEDGTIFLTQQGDNSIIAATALASYEITTAGTILEAA